jgi:hypothetical protein
MFKKKANPNMRDSGYKSVERQVYQPESEVIFLNPGVITMESSSSKIFRSLLLIQKNIVEGIMFKTMILHQ